MLKKITDFFAALKSSGRGGGRTGWRNDFLEKAGERLADASDIEAELTKLKAELQARLELEEMFKPKKEPSAPRKSIFESLKKADEKLAPVRSGIESLPGAKGSPGAASVVVGRWPALFRARTTEFSNQDGDDCFGNCHRGSNYNFFCGALYKISSAILYRVLEEFPA